MLKSSFFCLIPRFSLACPSSRTVCLSKMSTAPEPLCPKFTPVEKSEIASISKSEGFKFSLVSYNILAQAYVKSASFPHSPSPCLKWKARSQAILTVLKGLGSDFLCLQELDEYDSFYKKNIESFGYSSIYVQRGGQKKDGCGIFYKPKSAELIIEEKIDYNDLLNSIQDEAASLKKDVDLSASGNKSDESTNDSEQKSTQTDCGDPNDPRVRLKRDCVGIMAAFKLNDPSCHHIIVANTHIYWDPEWIDVKLAQAKYLLRRLAEFKSRVSDQFGCSPSVLVAGDFNSVPGDQVYQYIVSGTSPLGPQPEISDEMPIPVCSVYAYTKGEPPFTNCTPGFTGTLDYVLFSPSGDIKPVSCLELPGPESSDVQGWLPNYYHPSDHLPIGAEFEVDP
ncbi:PREDICTED: carbon catabolite repressor protein 4 homolog 4 isoform X2 [Ipomoea nil]|uniref:carbon catabolite repressor protein 4 homolog 4 isoform X2 n=1 Tax=Ipomoea nil TaxID=35883 RepID=UPI000901DA3E|nr:PREDICTED: carbon catabolite repressor protein 4 homolog 4 isoform X2 [Ipomoea nil]